jgi:hypothetical protein
METFGEYVLPAEDAFRMFPVSPVFSTTGTDAREDDDSALPTVATALSSNTPLTRTTFRGALLNDHRVPRHTHYQPGRTMAEILAGLPPSAASADVFVAGEEVPSILTEAARQVARTWAPLVTVRVCSDTETPHILSQRNGRVVFDATRAHLRDIRTVRDAVRLAHRACAAAALPNALFKERFTQMPPGSCVLVLSMDHVTPACVRSVVARQRDRMLVVASTDHTDVAPGTPPWSVLSTRVGDRRWSAVSKHNSRLVV